VHERPRWAFLLAVGILCEDNMWSTLRFDIPVVIRSLVRQPVFTAIVLATLAIGIGANTAMFAIVHAALLKPLPYKSPDRLVLARRTVNTNVRMWNSAPDYYDYRSQVTGLTSLAACGSGASKVTVTGGAAPERVSAMVVSHDLLSTLGVDPAAGRLFRADEGKAGAPLVVMISPQLAERRFGGVGKALGQTLAVVGMAAGTVSATVVGVFPETYRFLDKADVLTPMREGENDGPETRMFHNWVLVGRLADGETIPGVQARLDVISRRLQQQYPATNKQKALRLDPLQTALFQSQTPRLIVLMGAVSLVLLIACANVAGMLLARGVARRAEIAMRAALGASRGRLISQLLTESLLLSGAAGLLGVTFAVWLKRLLPAAAGLADSGVVVEGLSLQVLGFAFAASVVTGVLCGVVPALRTSSQGLAQDLAPGGRAMGSGGGTRLRGALVVSQVALSMVLLIGAGLLIRSLERLMSTDLRFETRGLYATAVDSSLNDPQARLLFLSGVIEQVDALPGVSAVTAISHLPIGEPWGDPPMWPAKHPPADSSQERTALMRRVMPGCFKALGARLIAGRDLASTDRMGTPPVIVINDAMAREFFPGENALGQHVVVAGGRSNIDAEVIGIVDNPQIGSVDNDAYPAAFASATQLPMQEFYLMVRSALPGASLTESIRRMVRARNPDVPVEAMVSMESVIGESLTAPRVTAVITTTFSVIALFLAALGLYGVLAYYVTQRTREIGVRMTLGADARGIVGHLLCRSAWMVVPGLGVGLVGALAGSKLIAQFLYEVPPTDPVTYVGVLGGLALTALVASAWPAWRAARVDPSQTLRGE
jgi:putative ABC transport system permease protein